MTDTPWAAREGDALLHTSMMADVIIGGEPLAVREIRSGKTPGVGLAMSTLLLLRGSRGRFTSQLPCMAVGGAVSLGVSQAIGALRCASRTLPSS